MGGVRHAVGLWLLSDVDVAAGLLGATAQVQALAQSTVPTVFYVSCNPASFARDARILVDDGYRLTRVVPLDQFLWSPHVELFAHFVRA